MKVTTYVKSVEAFTNSVGRCALVRVELANGLEFTASPAEAPKVGDYFDVTAEPSR